MSTTYSESVFAIIGERVGDSVAYHGNHEAARRLSHALAEIAAVLDTCYADDYLVHAQELSEKAKDVLKEWGVA